MVLIQFPNGQPNLSPTKSRSIPTEFDFQMIAPKPERARAQNSSNLA